MRLRRSRKYLGYILDDVRPTRAYVGTRLAEVTLYASSGDLALRASKLIHGYPRAGDTDPRVLIVKSVVTMDASRVDTNLPGHSYIGDSTSVDSLIRSGLSPDQREFFLDPAELDGQRYWVFVP